MALSLFFSSVLLSAENREIKSLDNSDPSVKIIREDVKKSLYVTMSARDVSEMPELRFFTYKVKKDDTFFKIQSRCSMDMDTLMTVNMLASARDIIPGRVIYIPNIRGTIVPTSDPEKFESALKSSGIKKEYILRVNRAKDFSKDYMFIPGGKVSTLERSLFIGSGFINPLPGGRRTSGFGTRKNPFDGKYFHFHTGVDIACPIGSKVAAARDGTVVSVGLEGGYGNLVVLRHDHNYYTYYGHLSGAKVKPGDVVKAGDIIASSGNTGRTTGPHLHFEVRRGGNPVNPGMLLNRKI